MSVIHVVTGQTKYLLVAVLAPDRGLTTAAQVTVFAIALSTNFISCVTQKRHSYKSGALSVLQKNIKTKVNGSKH